MRERKLEYLGQPYTHELAAVRELRATIGAFAVAILQANNRDAYSPLAHCHYANELFPVSEKKWLEHCHTMVLKCDSMTVLRLAGWKSSKGLKFELEVAEPLGKEIVFLDKEDFENFFAPQTFFALWDRHDRIVNG